jgi:hypothetical protein
MKSLALGPTPTFFGACLSLPGYASGKGASGLENIFASHI